MCYESLLLEQDTMRSKVDPARYLGSHVSLTDSISSSLRLGSPQIARPGDAFLLTLSENEKATDVERASGAPTVWNESSGKSRTLGTIRKSSSSSQRPKTQPIIAVPTASPEHLPNISKSKSAPKSRAVSEADADVTIVDADAVLDQGSELMLQMQRSPTRPVTPRAATPPLPSVDVLSKRQLKLIGIQAPSPNISCKTQNIDKPLSDLINSDKSSLMPKRAETAPARGHDITTSALFEMAGQVGERMMVNRARLLFMQHNASREVVSPIASQPSPKPPTAPPGLNHTTPIPSMQTLDSKTVSATSSSERATTAPGSVTHPKVTIKRRSSIRSAKLRGPGSASTSQSVPGRSDSRLRETQLSDPFTVRAVTPQTPSKTPQPTTPPPTATPGSNRSCRYMPHDDDDAFELDIKHTPYKERCAKYKDPHQETIGYLTLDDDDDDEISLSQTPLLNISQEGFSSLSSFLPSNTSLVS